MAYCDEGGWLEFRGHNIALKCNFMEQRGTIWKTAISNCLKRNFDDDITNKIWTDCFVQNCVIYFPLILIMFPQPTITASVVDSTTQARCCLVMISDTTDRQHWVYELLTAAGGGRWRCWWRLWRRRMYLASDCSVVVLPSWLVDPSSSLSHRLVDSMSLPASTFAAKTPTLSWWQLSVTTALWVVSTTSVTLQHTNSSPSSLPGTRESISSCIQDWWSICQIYVL